MSGRAVKAGWSPAQGYLLTDEQVLHPPGCPGSCGKLHVCQKQGAGERLPGIQEVGVCESTWSPWGQEAFLLGVVIPCRLRLSALSVLSYCWQKSCCHICMLVSSPPRMESLPQRRGVTVFSVSQSLGDSRGARTLVCFSHLGPHDLGLRPGDLFKRLGSLCSLSFLPWGWRAVGDREESWGDPEEEEEEAVKCGKQGLGRGGVLATVCLPSPHLLSVLVPADPQLRPWWCWCILCSARHIRSASDGTHNPGVTFPRGLS